MRDGSFVTCPRCEGRGPFTAFLHRSDGVCSVEEVPCSFCKGVGDVTDIQAHAFAKGRELMQLRQSCGRSLFEVADLLEIPTADYSGIEHGRRHANYEQIAQRIKDWR